MRFLYSEMPKITSFSHCISPRLPESATKVTISILRVNYTWDSAVHCHSTLPHSCTFTFWVPFWPNFHFFTFFGIKLALLSQSKASTSPFVPRAGFLEPCSCFFKTFHYTFLASVSTSARNQEKHQKIAKMRFFSQSAIFFAEKHFVGCRYIYGRTSLTCTIDSPSKEVYFQNFRQPYSI